MTTPAMPVQMPMPKCPHCKKQVVGLFITSLLLPTPDGRKFTFQLACCPNQECMAILSCEFMGEVEEEKPEPGSGLWTPPGGRN